MIQNEQQYQVTKAQAQKFEKALEEILLSSSRNQEVDPLLRQVQISALESQLDDLRDEIAAYEHNTNTHNNEFGQNIADSHVTKMVGDVLEIRDQQIKQGTSKFIVFLTTLRLSVEIMFALWRIAFSDFFSSNSAAKRVE